MIRGITGFGEGNGPFIAIHDGFDGQANWTGFLSGSDRIALDYHPYFAFNGRANDEPIDNGTGIDAGGIWPAQACHAWADNVEKRYQCFSYLKVSTDWLIVKPISDSPLLENSATVSTTVACSSMASIYLPLTRTADLGRTLPLGPMRRRPDYLLSLKQA